MFLGIEIGGTKLQLGVGTGQSGALAALERLDVDRSQGGQGIREQIRRVGKRLIEAHRVAAVGIGFGGPVNASAGRTITSFQIGGWDDFPLADWSCQALGLPTALENDSNLAGLAEARFGAGREAEVVLYSNVGSGIGGALVIAGKLFPGGSGAAVSEIGHLRPGPDAVRPEQTVESVASGWAMAAAARARLAERHGELEDAAAAELLARCDGQLERLSGKMVAEAAAGGNPLAQEVFRRGIRTYGWALAQAVTLLAPSVVVVGGGVSQASEQVFLQPLRQEVEQYVFPPLRGSYRIARAALGEEVVVCGALALAAELPP
jgi:glucokinase